MTIVLPLADHSMVPFLYSTCFSHSIRFPSSFLRSLSYFILFLFFSLVCNPAQSFFFFFFLHSSCHFSFSKRIKLNFNGKKYVICLDRSTFSRIIFHRRFITILFIAIFWILKIFFYCLF